MLSQTLGNDPLKAIYIRGILVDRRTVRRYDVTPEDAVKIAELINLARHKQFILDRFSKVD